MQTLSTVEALTPEAFLSWWQENWKQGEHVLINGMTGSGKTVLEIFLAKGRRFVIALDAKAGDSSLAASGWERVTRWPLPREHRDALRDNEPVRIILGKVARTADQMTANQALLARAVHDLWTQGRWTVICDEGQLLADRRFAGGTVGNDLEQMLIAARDRLISVVFTAQRPQIGRSTPAASAAQTQSTHIFVSRTRDRRVHMRLSEISGRPLPEMAGLVSGLPKFTWAYLGMDPHEPIRIFQPPPPPKPVRPAGEQGREPSRLSTLMWGHKAR